jgi:hypothetical protein
MLLFRLNIDKIIMVVLLKEKKNNTYCKNKQKKIRKLGQDAERTGPAHWPANESAECPEQIRDANVAQCHW